MLDSIFKPKSIAIVGASIKPGKIGYELVQNLVLNGYQGSLYPVNPRGGELLGYKVYSSIEELPDDIDLALIALPSQDAIDALVALCKKGVKSAIIYAAGFSEVGNVELEAEVRSLSDKYGVRIIGPNCAGIIYHGHKLYGAFIADVKDGDFALLSQSGAMTAVITEYLSWKNLGLHLLVSYGNRIDVKDSEIIEYFSDDPNIKAFMLYIEGLGPEEGRMLYNAIRNLRKPTVIFKAGRSAIGARAVKSHVGALAGSYKVYQGIFKQAGAYLVDDYYELVDVAETLAYLNAPRGGEVAVVTNSGGPAVALVDSLESLKISLMETPREVVERLSFLPPYMNRGNPIDLTASGNADLYYQVIKVLMDSRFPDIILALHVAPSFVNPVEIAKAIKDAYIDCGAKKPLIPLILGNKRWEAYKVFWSNPRLPTPLSHVSASKCVDALIRWSKHRNLSAN